MAIVKRQGAGKLRHINIGMLWIQEAERMRKLSYSKVAGVENPADMMTKGLQKSKIAQYMSEVGQETRGGRAERSLRAAKAE